MTSCACGRPAPGATLCRACAADLDRLLATVPGLYADLTVTLTRTDRVSVEVGGAGRDRPLPVNLGAIEAHRLLDATLCAWADAIGCPLHGADGRAAVEYLRADLDAVRRLPDAEACLDEVVHACALARRVVDLPSPRRYVGDCLTCGAAVHAPLDETTVECPSCGIAHDVEDGRHGILDAARDRVLPAADLVRLSRAYGVPTTAVVVSRLVKRGALVSVGTHADGRPTYRVGDLLTLLERRTTT